MIGEPYAQALVAVQNEEQATATIAVFLGNQSIRIASQLLCHKLRHDPDHPVHQLTSRMSGGHGLLSGLIRSLSGDSPMKPHLKQVPSFNDFSSGVAPDAELEYQSPKANLNKRAGSLFLPDFSRSPEEPNAVQRADTTVSSPANIVAGHAMDVPVKRTQSLRMQGMDAFEYCDLIRSL